MRGLVPIVRPFADVVIGDVRASMLALFAAVALVLLDCQRKRREPAAHARRSTARRDRAAGGAGRRARRIVRHALAESLVLAALAGIAGSAIAWASLSALVTLVPDGLPRIEAIRMDETVMVFALIVVLVTALLAGGAPGWLVSRTDILSPLRGVENGIPRNATTRGRRALVIAQVALAVTVLAATGLVIRTLINLQSIDLGLAADRLVLVDLHLPAGRYAEREQRAQFLDAAIAELEGVPGIAHATPVNISPFSDRGWDVPRIAAEGQSADEAAVNPSLNLESIHPNYFATLQVPILRGRAFTSADRDGSIDVAIVSEDAAARIWPHDDPIGKRLKMGSVGSNGRWLEVVGVAAQTRYRTVTTPRPTLYLPAAQFQMTAGMLVVRSTAPLSLLTSVANERIRHLDDAVQIMSVTPFSDLLDRPLARPRFAAFLLIVFGAMALLLTTVGLYAVVAAYARQRDREIALRLALGASAQSVRRLVLAEAARMAGFGVLLGLGGAVASTRALQGMLFEISPLDPMSIAAAAVLIGAAAALASYGPVRRAAHADLMSHAAQPIAHAFSCASRRLRLTSRSLPCRRSAGILRDSGGSSDSAADCGCRSRSAASPG